MSKLSNYLSLTRFPPGESQPPTNNWITDKLGLVPWFQHRHHLRKNMQKYFGKHNYVFTLNVLYIGLIVEEFNCQMKGKIFKLLGGYEPLPNIFGASFKIMNALYLLR